MFDLFVARDSSRRDQAATEAAKRNAEVRKQQKKVKREQKLGKTTTAK
jgi:hypothetical protein